MSKVESRKFKLSDYEIFNTLGTGTNSFSQPQFKESFGRVKLVKHKLTGKHYALKMIRKAQIVKSKQVDHVMNENQILSMISHPFIVNTEGFSQDSRYLYFMLQFVPGGELFSYMRRVGSLQPSHAYCYAAQITLVFQYLHTKNIVYRNLKPQNILIGEDGFLKLTDFGFAKVVQSRTFTFCGTPEYLAPEILLNKGHGKPVDWWTLGILIYEMIAGIDPFADDDPMIIYQRIIKGKIKFSKQFDKEAKSLVRHLLVNDLSKRFGNLKGGVNDIKEHRFFKGMDWKALLQKKYCVYYKPNIQKQGDASNFGAYPDSDTTPSALKPMEDPFLTW